MYDHFSTDDSVAIAKDLDMEVRFFGEKDILDDGQYLEVKNNCWKESRGIADYVIVCDADEFLFHRNLDLLLEKFLKKKISIPRTKGFQMVSEVEPVDSILEVDTGFRYKRFNKSIIFNPNLIDEINYNYGSHNHKASGVVRKSFIRLNVLHYRFIGGFERMNKRHEEYKRRLSEFNRLNRFGVEYQKNSDEKKKEWDALLKRSKKLFFLDS